jgi:hypothetical protein
MLAGETDRSYSRLCRGTADFSEITQPGQLWRNFRSNLHVTLTSCVASKSDLTVCRLNVSLN